MAAWDLSVIVEDLGPESPPITISVTSDLHIGGVIFKIVEKTRKLCRSLFISDLITRFPIKENIAFPIIQHLIPQTVKMKFRKEDLFSFCLFSICRGEKGLVRLCPVVGTEAALGLTHILDTGQMWHPCRRQAHLHGSA